MIRYQGDTRPFEEQDWPAGTSPTDVEIDALKKEIDRLREALGIVDQWLDGEPLKNAIYITSSGEITDQTIGQIVTAALKQE